MIDNFFGLGTLTIKPEKIAPDLGRCCNYDCNKVSKVVDCVYDYEHHDGWEMPAYGVHICPHCADGELENYFFSDSQWILYLKQEENN